MLFDQLKRREFITLLGGATIFDRHVLARDVAGLLKAFTYYWLDGRYDRLPSFRRATSAFAAWPEIETNEIGRSRR